MTKPCSQLQTFFRAVLLCTMANLLAGPQRPAVAVDYEISTDKWQQETLLDLSPSGGVVDPNIDGTFFNLASGSQAIFTWNFQNNRGDLWPIEQELFNLNQTYQSLRVQGTSTANTWQFTSGNTGAEQGRVNAIVGTKNLSVTDATLNFLKKTYPSGPDTYVGSLIISGGSPANLVLNNGHLRTEGSPNMTIVFGSDTVIGVSGSDNQINAQRIQDSDHRLELSLTANSTLDVVNSTSVPSQSGGVLTLALGSRLNVTNSEVALTSSGLFPATLATSITGATVAVDGMIGNDPANVKVTDPTISDSHIQMGHNTRFFSTRKEPAVYGQGGFYFSGTNTIDMDTGSKLLSLSSQGEDTASGVYFFNGTSTFNRIETLSGVRPEVRANRIQLDNATVQSNGVDLGVDTQGLIVRNNSTFKTTTFSQFNNVMALEVTDSTLTGANWFGENSILRATFTDATLSVDQAARPDSAEFFLNGFTGVDNGLVNFLGDSKIISRLDPAGTDIGLGVKQYGDSYYFSRSTDFTTASPLVNGLGNVTITLIPFAAGLTALDYASGGPNGDGIYDVLYFGFNGTGTTNATTDIDNVAVVLSPDMPAGLSVTQVYFPSSDGRVSYQLTAVPEPSGMVIAGLGCLTAGWTYARRRRLRKAAVRM